MKFAYLFLVAATLLAGCFFRNVWHHSLDQAYLRDLFDHSQWRIPLSSRVISDEQLYQHAGLYLVTTGDLFTVNPEVPPLAKYLYGWSFQIFGNPYLITPILLGLSLLMFYAICRQLKLSRETTTWLTGIVLISPVVFGQLSQTMLDLPQLAWLVSHIYFLFRLKKQTTRTDHVISASLAGLFLGAFAATKVPLLVPVVAVGAAYYLWSIKKLWLFSLVGIASTLFYIGCYLPYFWAGHTLWEWFGTQKWMVQFYGQSQVKAHPLLFPISVFTGWYQGWWGQPWQKIVEWSGVWPISFMAPFILLKNWLQTKTRLSQEVTYLTLLALALIGVHLIIPFWPRYFLLLLPLGLLCVPFVLKHWNVKLKVWFKVVGVIILVGQAVWFSRPNPTESLSLITSYWEKGNYQDLYQSLVVTSRPTDNSTEFHHRLKQVEMQLGRPEIKAQIPRTWPWQYQTTVPITINYQTPLGEYQHESVLLAHRTGSHWSLVWDWSVVAPTFQPGDTIVFEPLFPRLGTLTTADGVIISQAGVTETVSVIPKLVDEELTLRQVAEVTETEFHGLVVKLTVESIPDSVVPVGTIKSNSGMVKALKLEPGLVWSEVPDRVLSPDMATSAAKAWAELKAKEHPEVDGQLGGKLYLRKTDGTALVLIEKTVVDGKDVRMNELFQPAFKSQ